jgi:P27 family predicted phage terminase small subunit
MSVKKPTSLKIAQGTVKKSRLNPDEPTPPVGIPEPPTWVLSNPVALEEWNRVTPILADQGLITHLDMAELASYCSCFAQWAVAEKHLQAEGAVIQGPRGGVKVNPWVRISHTAKTMMHTFLRQFGMTPASRGNVTAIKQEIDNPLAQFLKPIPLKLA